MCCDLCGANKSLSSWNGFPVSMDFCQECETHRGNECNALFVVTAKSYLERARNNARTSGKMENEKELEVTASQN